MDTMHSRLRQARLRAGFPSARSAAQRFGWSPSTYGAHENGQNNFDGDTALAYAKAFSCDVAWLALGELPGKQSLSCEIMGIVFSPDDIKVLSPEKTDLVRRTATVIFEVPEPCKGLWVDGDGFWPRYFNRSLIIIRGSKETPSQAPKMVGEECFVTTKSGEHYLRVLSSIDESGAYLLSAHNRPTPVRISASDVAELWYVAMAIPHPNWGLLDLQLEQKLRSQGASASLLD